MTANGSPELIAALCLLLIGLSMIPFGGVRSCQAILE